MSLEFVVGVVEDREEGVDEWLEYAVRDVEELAQGWIRDSLHEKEVGPPVLGVGEPHDTVEDQYRTYAEFCDAQMQDDLGVDDALGTDF